ncbi:MAG: hypothetical protein ABI779_11605 [Acidobacteriota bacterium]
MTTHDPAVFHKLYGVHKPRVTYYGKDLIDYTLMILVTGAVIVPSYGFGHVLAWVGMALCAFMLVMFPVRHGVELKVPLFLRRPQDVLYMFVYKLQNLPPLYLVAIAVLLLENVLIAATPNLPHHVDWMRNLALVLFYTHILIITAYRTTILIKHLAKRELAREVLMQTPWKRVINAKTNITLEILHAYATGLLTHLVLITPWYVVMTHVKYSLVFMPFACLINLVVHLRWLKATNAWFYRDHWVGHNSEFEFIFLHGTHHDAIPCALIGVAGNGFLEGFFRGTLAFPIPFYNPIIPFLLYSYEIKQDMDLHQYIPGIYPKMPKAAVAIGQHSTHHYGRLEPYSIAIKLDQPDVPEAQKAFYGSPKVRALFPDELMNSLKLDEELNGFKWDNPTHKNTLDLWDKYQH